MKAIAYKVIDSNHGNSIYATQGTENYNLFNKQLMTRYKWASSNYNFN